MHRAIGAHCVEPIIRQGGSAPGSFIESEVIAVAGFVVELPHACSGVQSEALDCFLVAEPMEEKYVLSGGDRSAESLAS